MAEPTLPRSIQAATIRIQRLQAAHGQKNQARSKEATTLERGLGAAMGFAAVAIMSLAGLMDILSFFDVQIFVSWILYILGALVAFRINRIRSSKKDITKAMTIRIKEYDILRQRLSAAAIANNRPQLVVPVKTTAYQFSSYLTRYLLTAAATQLFELIPIVNWLPTFMAKHYRDIVHQRRELQEAKAMLIPYRILIGRITALERFEIELFSDQLLANIEQSEFRQQGERILRELEQEEMLGMHLQPETPLKPTIRPVARQIRDINPVAATPAAA